MNKNLCYIYDKAGNLVEDKSEQLKMRWTYYGKLKQIDSAGVPKLRFYYDAMGNRVVKENLMSGTKEVYVRDAQGNVIAVYEVRKKNNVDSLFSKEFYIYGSQRLGYLQDKMFLSRKTYGRTLGGAIPVMPVNPIISIPNPFLLPGTTTITPIYFGNKRYELSDWLGNVRVVINDKKTPVNSGTTTVSYFPQVMSVSDYYSFGSSINERTYNVEKYKYGFNDKENLDEVYGNGNFQDYGARMYDTRLGRFISADPIIINEHKYTFYSPYQFAGNKPTVALDLDGKEEMWTHTSYVNGQKQEMRIFSTDENYAVQKQYLAQQLGIDVSKFGMQGVLVTEERDGKISMMYNSMPAVEVSSHQWQGLGNEMGNFLSDSKLDKLNSAFVQRYYGSDGQERFVNDLQEQSTYVKAAGVVTGVAGVLTGNPILVEAGIGLYNVGDRMENIGEGIMAVREMSEGKWQDVIYRGLRYTTSETIDKASKYYNVNNGYKLMFRASKDYLLNEYNENESNNKSNKSSKNEDDKSRSRID